MNLTLVNYPQVIVSLIQAKSIYYKANIHNIEVYEYNGYSNFFDGNKVILRVEGYYTSNPEKNIKPRNTTALKRRSKSKISKIGEVHGGKNKTFRQIVYERDGYRCLKCGCDEINWLTLDHIIPRAKGGKNSVANLQTLCANCNMEKGDKHSTDYRK